MGVGALPLIGSSYIKDDKLLQLTQYAFAGSNADTVNIYVDLSSVLSKIVTPNYDLSARCSDYEIASGIINMIAHYRAFFLRKLRVNTRFFFVYSVNNSINNKTYFPMYNSTHNSNFTIYKDRFSLLVTNLSLVEKMIPYIPDACVTMIRQEPCTAMLHIMEVENSSYPNIVITKDPVTMQICTMYPNTVIYRPKKYKGEDTSFAIVPSNNGLYYFLADDRGCKKPTLNCEISPELYSFVLSIIGVKSRDMNSLMSYTSIMKQLDTAIFNNKIINAYNWDIRNIYEEFDDKTINTLVIHDIEKRFKALDLRFQYGLYINSTDRHNYKGIQNLYDPVGFHEVCEEYFRECPIDVERM